MKKITVLCFSLLFCIKIIEAHPGIGIVMDSNGNVFYTDLTHVWKISPNGTRTVAVSDVHTHELYIDGQDNLYGEHEYYEGEATDKWGNYVWRLSQDGVLEKTIPDVEGFLDDNTLVRDSKGNSYWAEKSGDFEILKRQNTNGVSTLFTEHHFRDIRWMYFSKTNNNLYVIDYLTIKKVSPSGKVTVLADNLKEASPPFAGVADHHYLFGMWSDNNINLYVALFGASKVKKISANGEVSTVFESQEGWSPCGGMITPDGTQWIMEFSEENTTRVRKINPDGTYVLYGSS